MCVCVCVCMCVLVAQLCPTLCDPMDCSWPDSSVQGIFQARILDWVAIPFSRRSSQPRDWTQVSWIAGRFFTIWDTREAPYMFTESESRSVMSDSLQHHGLYSPCNFPGQNTGEGSISFHQGIFPTQG